MSSESIISKLESNLMVFKYLLENCEEEGYVYRADSSSWCLLEVVCHLYDEEREDFRERVQHILTAPDTPLRPIAPEKWPLERNYLGQDFGTVSKAFFSERQASIFWLKGLKNPKWEQTVDDPKVGPRSAMKFLVNWLAHDYHHIRQINRINHAYLKYKSGDDLTYAGKW